MSEENFMFIKSGKRLTKIFFDDIILIKGLGNYVEIVTQDKKHIYYQPFQKKLKVKPKQLVVPFFKA